MGNTCCRKGTRGSYTVEHPLECPVNELRDPDMTHRSLGSVINQIPRDDKKFANKQSNESPSSNRPVHDLVPQRDTTAVCVNGKASNSNSNDTLKAEHAGDNDAENIDSAYEFIDIEIQKQNQRDLHEAHNKPVYDDTERDSSGVVGATFDDDDDKSSISSAAAVAKSQDNIALTHKEDNVALYAQDNSEQSGSIAENHITDPNTYEYRTQSVPQCQTDDDNVAKVTDSDDSDSDVVIPSQNQTNARRIEQEDYSHELIKTTEHVSIINTELDGFQANNEDSEITKDQLGLSLLPPDTDDATSAPSLQHDALYMTEPEAQNDTDMFSNDSNEILVSSSGPEKSYYDNPGFTNDDLPKDTDSTTSGFSNTSGNSSLLIKPSAAQCTEMPPQQEDALREVHMEIHDDNVETLTKDTKYLMSAGQEMDERYHDNLGFINSDIQEETDIVTLTQNQYRPSDYNPGQSSYSNCDKSDTNSDIDLKELNTDTSTKATNIEKSTLLTIPPGDSSPRTSSDGSSVTHENINDGRELKNPKDDDTDFKGGYLPKDTDSETSNLKINDSDDSSLEGTSHGYDITNESDKQNVMVCSDTANSTNYVVKYDDAISSADCQILPQETTLQKEENISSFTDNARDDSATIEDTALQRKDISCVQEDDVNEIWTKIEMEQENICYELRDSDIKDCDIQEQLAETLNNVCSLRNKIFEKQIREVTLEGRSTVDQQDGHEEMMLVEEIEMWFDEAVVENNKDTADKLLTERSNYENLKTLLEEHGQNYNTLLREKEQRRMILEDTLRDQPEGSEPDQTALQEIRVETNGDAPEEREVDDESDDSEGDNELIASYTKVLEMFDNDKLESDDDELRTVSLPESEEESTSETESSDEVQALLKTTLTEDIKSNLHKMTSEDFHTLIGQYRSDRARLIEEKDEENVSENISYPKTAWQNKLENDLSEEAEITSDKDRISDHDNDVYPSCAKPTMSNNLDVQTQSDISTEDSRSHTTAPESATSIDVQTTGEIEENISQDQDVETDVQTNISQDHHVQTDVQTNISQNQDVQTDLQTNISQDQDVQTDLQTNISQDQDVQTDVQTNISQDHDAQTVVASADASTGMSGTLLSYQTDGHGVATECQTDEPIEDYQNELLKKDADFLQTVRNKELDRDEYEVIVRDHLDNVALLRRKKQEEADLYKEKLNLKLNQRQQKNHKQQDEAVSSDSENEFSEDNDARPTQSQDPEVDLKQDDEDFEAIRNDCFDEMMKSHNNPEDLEAILNKYRERQNKLQLQRKSEKQHFESALQAKLANSKVKKKNEKHVENKVPESMQDIHRMDEEFYQELCVKWQKEGITDEQLEAAIQEHLDSVEKFRKNLKRQLNRERRKRDKANERENVNNLVLDEQRQLEKLRKMRHQQKWEMDRKLQDDLEKRKQGKNQGETPQKKPRKYQRNPRIEQIEQLHQQLLEKAELPE